MSELLIATSYSKNFGLYNERVGALTRWRLAGRGESALSQIKSIIRANYSNPPAHGAKIVTRSCGRPSCGRTGRSRWPGCAAAFTRCGGASSRNWQRTASTRLLFYRAPVRDVLVHRADQGSGPRAGDRHAIYIVDSGRINVAGLTEANLPTLCAAIASVL